MTDAGAYGHICMRNNISHRRRKMFRPAERRVLSGQRPRCGRVWGVFLPMGVDVNFSEYSVVISAPVQCFIQTAKQGGNKDCWGRLPNEAWRAENRGWMPRARWGSWGEAASPLPPARGSGERCELSSGVQGGAPTAQRFSTIFSTQDGLSWRYNIINFLDHKKNS